MNWKLLFKDIKRIGSIILPIIFAFYFILWVTIVAVFNTADIDFEKDLIAQDMYKYVLLPGNYIFGIVFIIGIVKAVKYLYNRYKV